VKLDFLCGLISKALRATGGDESPANRSLFGEALAYRNLFWALSDAMCHNPEPWPGGVAGALLPESKAAFAYRVFAPDAYPRIRDIIMRTVTSALIYLPSSAKDFFNSDEEPFLAQYVRGSHGIGHRERIKVMKLLWDAVGTEFGGRHELYERNYAGSWDDVRLQTYMSATRGPTMKSLEAFVDRCMSDYDESGWVEPTWRDE